MDRWRAGQTAGAEGRLTGKLAPSIVRHPGWERWAGFYDLQAGSASGTFRPPARLILRGVGQVGNK
jgi:hypothetical protein